MKTTNKNGMAEFEILRAKFKYSNTDLNGHIKNNNKQGKWNQVCA